MPEPDQVELIDAHPRLGAPPGTVSAMSFAEQGYDRGAGTRRSRPDLAAELERRNDAYETRFGFRYCVFVDGRTARGPAPRDDRRARGGPRTPSSTAPSTRSSTSPSTVMPKLTASA